MNTAITTPQTFEEKMRARIKDSIGDLITDEELTKMVVRAMEELFFKDRSVHMGSYGQTKELPPLIHEIVKDALAERVLVAVVEYINAHGSDVEKTIKDVLHQGMGAALVAAVTSKFHGDLLTFQSNLMSSIQR